MKKETIVIKGITYTVSATTGQGLKDAIKMLKKALKSKEDDNKNTDEEHAI